MATAENTYRGGPAPPHIRKCPPLRYLWRRMHINNKNVMLTIIGDPGEGKSWAALRLAELLDPEFTAEKVAFRPEKLLRRINENHPMGDVTIADEAGVAMNAKTWWESEQIEIGNILETWRHQNRMAIFTIPVLQKLQKDARGLMNVLLSAYGINRQESKSRWRFRLVETNNETGDIYKAYPRLPDPVSGAEVKYKTIDLGLPSDDLRDAYQKRKADYTAELNQRALDNVKSGDDEGASQNPKAIAEDILEGNIEAFVSQNPINKRQYIDQDLIEIEYGLSARKAKQAKKLVQSEVDLEAEL